MKAIGRSMAIAGAAIVAGFGMAIKTAAQFEQSMANTASVADATAEELKKLSDYAREMGEQSVFSASQAADGMYYLASAGMKTNEIMGALEGTLALAAATASDLAFTSESVAATLSQFGLEAEEAGRVANVFAAAISGSQATMDKLSTSMSYVGPMAKSMGMALEDTVGILMNLYNAGLDGSTAGTALRMAFVKLIEPTEKGTAALEGLEVAIKNSDGKMRPFKDIIDDLGVAGMSTADAMAIFGIRAGPAMMSLVGEGTGAIQKMTDTVTGTEKAFEMMEMQIDTFQGAMKLLKSKFEELQITLVQDLMPALKGMIEKITEGIKKVSDWMKENPKLTETIVKWTASIGALMLVLGPLLIILPGLIAGLIALKVAFIPFLIGGGIVVGLIAIGVAMNKLTGYLRETVGGMRELREEIDKMTIVQLDVKIQSLTDSAEQLQKRFYEISKGLGQQQILTMIDEINKRLKILYKQREELTKAEKEGIDVTEEKLKIDKEVKKIKEELETALKKEKRAIEAKTKSEKLSNTIKEIGNRIYKLTHTAMRVSIRNLDLQRKAYLKVGISVKEVNEWYKLEIAELKKLNKEIGKITVSQKTMAKATGEVYDKWYELSKLWAVRPDLQKYFRMNAKEVAEFGKKIEEVTFSEETMAKATGEVYDKWYELSKLWAVDPQLRKRFELDTEALDKFGKKVKEVGEAFITLDNTIKPIITSITGYLETQLANAISGLLGGIEDFEWSWKTFWEGLKTVLINAVVAMIAKLVVLAALSWLFPWLTPFLGKGGGVGYEKGGEIEGYQAGGSSKDTVPAMLTPGEYVISKPMVDFIKRTGAVTNNLVNAIKTGVRTPIASFAGGGGVSSPISNTYNQQKSYSVNIQPGAIQIITPKFSGSDAKDMFRLIEREAKMRGLAFGRA